MTSRLYYTEPDRRAFDATVRACEPAAGRAHVLLDATAFYPTSGGQPFDTGRLGDARVLDVIDREDGEVVHVVDRPIAPGSRVHGEIDWARRFDHMQQHTGQHMLSAAFDRLSGARTVSFHLGAGTSTIDLAREVSPGEIARAEAEANRVVWDDRPVTVRFASDDEVAGLRLRKEPTRAGTLRLIEVADFDLSACGGTHVSSTGRIGVIAVAGWERFKGGSRVLFVCGGRALAAFGHLRDVVGASTRRLSVSPDDLEAAIVRLQTEGRDAVRLTRRLETELAVHRAAGLRASAETIGRLRVVIRHEPAADLAGLRGLAAAVVSEPGFVAVLVGDGEPAPIVVARSADIGLDAGGLMKWLTTELGGRGGGRPELAQGGVSAAPGAIVARARSRLGNGADTIS